jgi:hypothetical protein
MAKFEIPAPEPLEQPAEKPKRRGLPFVKSLEKQQKPEMEEPEEEAEEMPAQGSAPGYRGAEKNCEGCEYFDLFGKVTCKKFNFDADPTGTCDAHEPISGFNTEEDSDNMDLGEEESPEVEAEAEE